MSFQIADGHVEVHLRDSTEAEWRQIRRRLETAARNPVNIRVEVEGDRQALQRIERLNRQLARLRTLASRPIEIRVDFDDRGAEQAMQRMLVQMQLLRAHADTFSRDWEQAWRRFGQQSASGARDMSASFQQAGASGAAAMQKVGLAIAALPAAANVAAAGVTLALGGALSGLGLTFAAQSDLVRDEATALARDLGARMRDISQPFQRTWLDIFDVARETFAEFEPELARAFDRLAPTVTGFARDVGEAFEQLAPYIDDWTDSFQILAGRLGPQLEVVFDNLGQAMTALTDAAARNPEVFGEMLQDASALAVVLAQVAGSATDLYQVMNPLSGSLSSATGVTGELIKVLTEFGKIAMSLNNPVVGVVYLGKQLGDAFRDAEAAMKGGYLNTARMADAFATMARDMGAAMAVQPGATSAFAALDAELAKAADNTLNLDQRLQALKNAMDQLLNPSLALYNTKTQLAAGMQQLRDAVEKARGSLSNATQASRAAREAFARQVATTAQLGEATFRTTGDMNKARKAVAEQIPMLWRLAGGNKEAQAQVAALARQFGISGNQAFTSKKKAQELDGAIRRLKSKTVTIQANTGPAFKSVQEFIAWSSNQFVKIYIDAIGRSLNADGNVYPTVRSFASGGENHTAQIARGGMTRVWNEPETGGEAYIPLAASKRERSEQILATVAERFGLMLTRPVESFAGGGVKPGGGSKGGGGLPRRAHPIGPTPLTQVQKAIQDLLKQLTRGMMSSLDQVNEWARKVNEQIRKAFSGAQEKRLLEWAKVLEGRMRQAATRAEAIAAKIKEAREYAANTAEAARQFASVQGLGTVGGARDILSGLQFRAGQLGTFASQITALKARGIDSGLLEQVIGLGAGQGSNLADQLLKADPETWRRLNEAQAAIDKAAKELGMNAADALFDSGKHASDGFLTGLLGQEADLQALMDRLADRFADRLGRAADLPGMNTPKGGSGRLPKRAFVSRADGGIVRASQWAMVGERGREMVRFGGDAQVYDNRRTERMLGGGVHIGSVTVQVAGTWDLADEATNRRVAQMLVRNMREELRREEMRYA